MRPILFALPGNEALAQKLAVQLNLEIANFTVRSFPDGETYVRILSDVSNKQVIFVCTLHQPNDKFLSLYFLAETVKSLGAKHICLVAPYLAYMRQDKIFQPGEGITSEYFAKIISGFVDSLLTVDPHLHRTLNLTSIYNIPTKTVHAATLISKWIKKNISNTVLIGPDHESKQWVREVASLAGAPFMILNKVRRGDMDVEISFPDLGKYQNNIPVLVDDIISTARTMIATITHLKNKGLKPPVCIGVHAVFAENAYRDLLNAGAAKVITCNTIIHKSNRIDLSNSIGAGLKDLLIL